MLIRADQLAICLVSGGMDSCVCAAMAARQGRELAFLHISYGQRTEERERRAFSEIADYYAVRLRKIVSVSYLREFGGSALTDSGIAVPESNLSRREIPASYVPFRNANLLAIAVSWGEVIGAKEIHMGAVQDDSSGYPDCRRVFFDAFNQLIRVGTRPQTTMEIQTPLIGFSKAEIVRRGFRLNVPFELTWSCYKGSQKACGVCDSCALRMRAFAQAGAQDPIPYESAVGD